MWCSSNLRFVFPVQPGTVFHNEYIIALCQNYWMSPPSSREFKNKNHSSFCSCRWKKPFCHYQMRRLEMELTLPFRCISPFIGSTHSTPMTRAAVYQIQSRWVAAQSNRHWKYYTHVATSKLVHHHHQPVGLWHISTSNRGSSVRVYSISKSSISLRAAF